MRIVTTNCPEPWDIVVYPRFFGKYGNNIFMFNGALNICNISLEFMHNFGCGESYPKEPYNQSLRAFAHNPQPSYFHDGEGYVPPNGECGIIILKYQDWKRWILKTNPDSTRLFYEFIEKTALDVLGKNYKVK